MKESFIGILMATYNGEKYISEQIDSILNQTYKSWQLLIHDDGSSDKTVEIVKKYVKNHPDKIFLIEDGIKCGGAKENFAHLMKIVKEKFKFDYIMFSDQDDVWLENKIEKTLNKMQRTEEFVSKKVPILVHTDLKVVDENLKFLSVSFWKYQKLNPDMKQFNYLLVQNNVTGCTVMINRSLLDKAILAPKNSIMHDWWLALVASAFGEITYLKEPLILYRQHEGNNVGAKEWSIKFIFHKLKNKENLVQSLRKTFIQAENFKIKYKNQVNDKILEILDAFILIPKVDYILKLRMIFRYRFFKQNFGRNIAYFWYLKDV